MSTISLAAQRSYTTGEAVWFSYRLSGLRHVFAHTVLGLLGLCAMLMAGLYAHVYWDLRHPAPAPINASSARPGNTAFRYALCVCEQTLPASAP